MKHNIHLDGVGYRLRPVTPDDAQFTVDVRLEDEDRNKYIHKISPDVNDQVAWIESYHEREGDYYFVIENRLTGEPEGLVGIYDIENGAAEWGRWVIKKGSLASNESLFLLFKVAFEKLDLRELYCRTICENEAVVAVHDSLPQLKRGVLENFLLVNDVRYDVVEHYTTKEHFYTQLLSELERKSILVFQRNFRALLGPLEFHHVGVATDNIEREYETYRFLGYTKEGESFEDPEQGIRGQFIIARDQPRLELLENLEGSSTLNVWLENRIKMYHFAYKVSDIEKVVETLGKNRIKIVSPLKPSTYFKKRICFLMLTNRFLIELIES